MRRNPSSVTTAAINTTSGHSCRSALNGYHQESLSKVNEMAKYTLAIKCSAGQMSVRPVFIDKAVVLLLLREQQRSLISPRPLYRFKMKIKLKYCTSDIRKTEIITVS